MSPDFFPEVAIILFLLLSPVGWIACWGNRVGNEVEGWIGDGNGIGLGGCVRHSVVDGAYLSDTKCTDLGEDPEFGAFKDGEPLFS